MAISREPQIQSLVNPHLILDNTPSMCHTAERVCMSINRGLTRHFYRRLQMSTESATVEGPNGGSSLRPNGWWWFYLPVFTLFTAVCNRGRYRYRWRTYVITQRHRRCHLKRRGAASYTFTKIVLREKQGASVKLGENGRPPARRVWVVKRDH